MFNLESKIDDWRKKVSQAGSIEKWKIDELADHLYCDIQELERQGHSPEDAYKISIKKIGTPKMLLNEFDKEKSIRVPFLATAEGDSIYVPNYLPLCAGVLLLLGLTLSIFTGTTTDRNENLDLNLAETTFSKNWLASGPEISSDGEILLASILSQHHQPKLVEFYLNRKLPNGSIQHEILQLSLQVDNCSRNIETKPCSAGRLEDELIRLDGDNITPYLYKFKYHIRNNDTEKALLSLQQGLKTNYTNDYYYEKFSFLKQQLSNIGFPRERLNWVSEVYASDSLISAYSGIIEYCTNQSTNFDNWRGTCLEIGARLMVGTTLLSYVYGASLSQSIVEATSNDENEVRAARHTRNSYNRLMQFSNENIDWWSSRTKFPDVFYDNAMVYGEVQAILMANNLDKTFLEDGRIK